MNSSSPIDSNRQSTWIFRTILAFACTLVMAGGVFMLFDEDKRNTEAFSMMTPDMSQTTIAGQSMAANAALNPAATPIDWEIYLPLTDGQIPQLVVERFGRVAYGPADAPVTLIEFGSYGCVSCRKVHQLGMLNRLFEKHPNQIRFVFVVWPFIHPNDRISAEAAMCALDQGAQVFWDYHNALLDLTDMEFDRYTTYQRYSSLAEHIEMDTSRFDTCMVDGLHREFVVDLIQAGFELGLRGTPTFFINGEPTMAYDLERDIDKALEHYP